MSKTVSDREKFEKLGFNREPKDQDIFSNFFKDMTIDIRTGELLGRYLRRARHGPPSARLPRHPPQGRYEKEGEEGLTSSSQMARELGDLIRAQPVEDRAADLFDMPWRRPAERLEPSAVRPPSRLRLSVESSHA